MSGEAEPGEMVGTQKKEKAGTWTPSEAAELGKPHLWRDYNGQEHWAVPVMRLAAKDDRVKD